MKIFEAEDGSRVEIEGALPRHYQIYTHEFLGSWNISRIQEEWERYKQKFYLVPITIDERLLSWIAETKDVDRERIRELIRDASNDGSKMKYPAIGLQTKEKPPDAPAQALGIDLIDGHHKIIVAHAVGVKTWPCIVVPLARKERYRVRYYISKPGEPRRRLENIEVLGAIWGRYSQEGSGELR